METAWGGEMAGETVCVEDFHFVIFAFSFNGGQFEAAIEHYTRALDKDPENAKTFSNRAACYFKLEQLNLCIKVRIRFLCIRL